MNRVVLLKFSWKFMYKPKISSEFMTLLYSIIVYGVVLQLWEDCLGQKVSFFYQFLNYCLAFIDLLYHKYIKDYLIGSISHKYMINIFSGYPAFLL